jgi:hypothetical protein
VPASAPETSDPARRSRAPDRRVGPIAERWIVLALGLLAAVPVLVSAVRAIGQEWVPLYDDAIIATRAFDALTERATATGQYSDASVPEVGPIYNAGPMLFWLLALPARVPGYWAMPVAVGLLNAACVVGVVVLARRRGGLAFAVVTAVAMTLLCRALSSEVLHAILNTSIALLPFTLLLFLAWSVACGELGLLPLTVLVGSFLLQAHFTVAGPAVAVLAVAFVGAVLWARRQRALGLRPGARPWLLALAVGVLCWIVPLVDELVDRPGNLRRTLWTAEMDQATLGLSAGWHSIVRAVGVLPWWLREPLSDGLALLEVFGTPPAVGIVSSLVVLTGLVAAVAVALRRRRPDVIAGVAPALLAGAVVVVAIARTPERLAIFAHKTSLFAIPVGMFSWLVLGWCAATLTRERWGGVLARTKATRAARDRGAVATASGVAIVALSSVLVSAGQQPDTFGSLYGPIRSLGAQVEARVPSRGPLQIVSRERTSGVRDAALVSALVYRLRRAGYDPVIQQEDFVGKFGPFYSWAEHPPVDVLVLDERPPAAGQGRLVARIPAEALRGDADAPAPFPPRPIVASVVPGEALRACPLAGDPAMPAPARRPLRGASDELAGAVERSRMVGDRAVLCGWVAGPSGGGAVDAVAVFAGKRLVAAVRPAGARPDVVIDGREVPGAIAFSLNVPRDGIARSGRSSGVRVLAMRDGTGTRLRFDCRLAPQDLGC